MAPIHATEPSKSFHDSMLGDSYVRERQEPRFRDVNYLHLKDLLDLMRDTAPNVKGDVFDYGCGCAAYRALFKNSKSYVAADIVAGPTVDRVLNQNGMTDEANESYDAVLSTQVLEHVKEPDLYIRECARILRHGGELILTTHGMFEEHGCPYDFQRWTSRGLEELVVKHGFEVLDGGKLTTEMRAFVQLLNQMVLHLRYPEKFSVHWPLSALRKMYNWLLVPVLNWFADSFKTQAKASTSAPPSLYVCVFVRARKIAPKQSGQI